MKKYYWLILVVGLFSCGENTDEADASEESNNSENSSDTIVTPEGVTITSEYVEPEEGQDWQIDNYAENLVNAKIAENSDAMMEEGTMYYYSAINKKGGYASVTGMFEGWYEFVLWRMANGNDLIGYESVGCGPVCDYTFAFYEFEDGKKREVTSEVIPLTEMDEFSDGIYPQIIEKYPNMEYPQDWFYKYEFPQEGTSMTVHYVVGAEEFEMPMFKLSWDRSKFSIEETYDEIPELK